MASENSGSSSLIGALTTVVPPPCWHHDRCRNWKVAFVSEEAARIPLPWGKFAIGLLTVIVSFGAALWPFDSLGPGRKDRRPALVDIPPLKPVTRQSVIVTPAAISLSAIHTALEGAAPRNLAGKRDNPLPQLLSNAELDWTVARGPAP